MQIRGLEALVRWNSPELGLIMPSSFIPVAENNRYIITMGEWILRQGCNLFTQFQKLSKADIILSVNISSVQMMSSGFTQMIKTVLEETGLNPESLELEVTESVLISSMEHAKRILTEIKTLGVKIALDDFGTGYSSLNYIQKLPIDTLKMDRAFIAGATEHNAKYEIVGTIIKLAHQMNLAVVAEGIENEQQLHYLKQNGCDYLQGFLLNKPLEKHAITELFTEQTPIRHSR
jgi:EAL domain-containing protein (putative c-di-GMP-specific phosphodiesterase class I)